MRKSTILNFFLFVAVTSALAWLMLVEANPAKDKLYADFGRWLAKNLLANPEIEAHVEERRLALQRFQAATDDVEAALCAGDLDLAQAVEQILGLWHQEFPEPVGQIAQFEPGDTDQERLARSIVRRIEQNERSASDAARGLAEEGAQDSATRSDHLDGVTPRSKALE